MSVYFSDFPIIDYSLNKDDNTVKLTNILSRFKPLKSIISRVDIYYDYYIKEGERPEIVSYKIYGTPDYSELILLFNSILDPYFSWPLHYEDFERYIESKYGSIQMASQKVHHYEWITQAHEVLYDGMVLPEKTLEVNQTYYNSLTDTERRIVYCIDYETQINDKKRTIKLIDSSYIPQILEEKEKIFKS